MREQQMLLVSSVGDLRSLVTFSEPGDATKRHSPSFPRGPEDLTHEEPFGPAIGTLGECVSVKVPRQVKGSEIGTKEPKPAKLIIMFLAAVYLFH